MEVQLLFVQDCPNVEVARKRIIEAARRTGIAVHVRERLVVDEAGATASGMAGSPTVLVSGADVVGTREDGSLSCRLFPTSTGYDGSPDVETIEAALTRAAEGEARASGS